jgi:hypothetical protein
MQKIKKTSNYQIHEEDKKKKVLRKNTFFLETKYIFPKWNIISCIFI